MSILTIEEINKIAPEHSRTSCSDECVSNGFGGWRGDFSPRTGAKVIDYPRCNRCYLLDNLERDTDDLDFKIVVSVELVYKGSPH